MKQKHNNYEFEFDMAANAHDIYIYKKSYTHVRPRYHFK
jgi:hypothetical protein